MGSDTDGGFVVGVVGRASDTVAAAGAFSVVADVACARCGASAAGAAAGADLVGAGDFDPVYSISCQQPVSKKIGATRSQNRIEYNATVDMSDWSATWRATTIRCRMLNSSYRPRN